MFDTIIDIFKYKPIIIADIGLLILMTIGCVTITTLLVLIWIYGIPANDDDSDKETYPIGDLSKIVIVFVIIATWMLAYTGGYAIIQSIRDDLQLIM